MVRPNKLEGFKPLVEFVAVWKLRLSNPTIWLEKEVTSLRIKVRIKKETEGDERP